MTDKKYSNEKVPENINSGHEHPLLEFVKSSALVLIFIGILIFGGFWAARQLAPFTPFSWEQALVKTLPIDEWAGAGSDPKRQAYLEALSKRVSKALDVPDDMPVTVHYVKGSLVNAFATLGGHVFIFEGLWDRLDSENALAMLVGHEIAHVKHRDPVKSAGGYLIVSLTAGALLGNFGWVDAATFLTAMRYSRNQESEADAAALRAVNRLYGHVNGAVGFFEVLKPLVDEADRPMEILASHPNIDRRIADLKDLAKKEGWSTTGTKTPLP